MPFTQILDAVKSRETRAWKERKSFAASQLSSRDSQLSLFKEGSNSIGFESPEPRISKYEPKVSRQDSVKLNKGYILDLSK